MDEAVWDAAFVRANELIAEDRYDEAIRVAKPLVQETLGTPDCIWPAGVVVAAYVFKCRQRYPYPGSEEYEEMRLHLQLTLDAYDSLPPELQQQYERHNTMFSILRPTLEVMRRGGPLSEVGS